MLLLLACVSGELAPEPNDTAESGDTAEVIDDRPAPAALAEPTTGACPDFGTGGEIEFESGGLARSAYVFIPEGAEGLLPVVFAWHPLGGNARLMKNWIDAESYAQDNGAIVIVPDASGEFLFEWDFVGDGEEDLALYDDLRTCAVQELNADVRRISALGFSAGALWTSFLAIHRGDTLATVLVWSGGTDPIVQYSTPAYPFPALLSSGGEDDVYGGGGFEVKFQDATEAFAAQLANDGHFVGHCQHQNGHDFPPSAEIQAKEWILPHVYGEPSPFAGGDLSAFTGTDCSVITPE